MSEKERQHTVLGILCLLLAVIPVAGILVNRAAERRCPVDTNGNTLATIGRVVAVWFTLLWIPVAASSVMYVLYWLGWVTVAH